MSDTAADTGSQRVGAGHKPRCTWLSCNATAAAAGRATYIGVSNASGSTSGQRVAGQRAASGQQTGQHSAANESLNDDER